MRRHSLYVNSKGSGPGLLLVHGTAADADAWAPQRRTLAGRFRVITYDRRGTSRSPVPAGTSSYSVAEHAADAAALIESSAERPALICGFSFGGVCVLELARTRPDLVGAAIVCEPPLPPADDGPLAPESYRAEFDRLRREQGGEAAAEFFLRTVLGPGYEQMPPLIRDRCLALHEQIVLDSDALAAYRVDYPDLASVELPVLLLGGERSRPFFRPTLEALEAALPRARLRIVPRGTHMMHADAFRAFNAAIVDFAAELGVL